MAAHVFRLVNLVPLAKAYANALLQMTCRGRLSSFLFLTHLLPGLLFIPVVHWFPINLLSFH